MRDECRSSVAMEIANPIYLGEEDEDAEMVVQREMMMIPEEREEDEERETIGMKESLIRKQEVSIRLLLRTLLVIFLPSMLTSKLSLSQPFHFFFQTKKKILKAKSTKKSDNNGNHNNSNINATTDTTPTDTSTMSRH